MLDVVAQAAGKLDDPLLLEWAVRYYEDLSENAFAVRAHIESVWFHDVVLARLVEQPDFKTLPALLRLLPPDHFANLTPLFLSQWTRWPGRVAGLAVPILAQHAPYALLDLLERELARGIRGGELDPARFSGLGALRGADVAERRGKLIEGLAEWALGQSPDDYRMGFLLVNLLAEADALPIGTVERVLGFCLKADGREQSQQVALKQLFKGLFGQAEYLDLVFARAAQQSDQTLSTLMPFFEPSAPLEQLDQWLGTPPRLVDVFPVLVTAGRCAEAAKVMHHLLSGSALTPWLSEQRQAQLAVAGCLHAYAVKEFDATLLDLGTTLDLLAADLDQPRWVSALSGQLTQFSKPEVADQLIRRLPSVSQTYGGMQIISAMGALGWGEFIPSLIDALRSDQRDFLCEAAKKALLALGAPARDALIAHWDEIDVSQQIYGLSVIQGVGGEAAADFALARWGELLKEDEEAFCELLLAVPDPRMLEQLRPDLRRKQPSIDRCYAIVAQLLDRVDDDARKARERTLAEYVRSAQLQEAVEHGDFSRDSLSLSLRCTSCSEVNTYKVAGAILPGPGHSDLPYLIEDEFPCASCGAWGEFEFTPMAKMALLAETVLINAARESHQERRPLVRSFDCRLGGQVMPLAAGLQRCRERLSQHAQDGPTWYQLGLLYASIRRPRAALMAFEQASALLPTAVTVTLRKAELLAADNRLAEALDLLTAAWPRRQGWQIFGDPRTVQLQFIDLHNQLRRQLGRTDLPALHPASIREARKVGRNDPCPCGSGRKFKQCCGK
jgi:tetratricopeptide (TPR) repeat protein